MPNWACGYVEAKGKRASLLAFADRFLDNIYGADPPATRYFARSFLAIDKESLNDMIREMTKKNPDEDIATVAIPVEFAWSAYSCMIDGYPQQFPEKCITLSEACVQDRVSVHIYTEETGMYFEEDITADSSGEVQSTCVDLKTARCCLCGCTMGVASFTDLDDLECYECGETEFEIIEEEK